MTSADSCLARTDLHQRVPTFRGKPYSLEQTAARKQPGRSPRIRDCRKRQHRVVSLHKLVIYLSGRLGTASC